MDMADNFGDVLNSIEIDEEENPFGEQTYLGMVELATAFAQVLYEEELNEPKVVQSTISTEQLSALEKLKMEMENDQIQFYRSSPVAS